MVHLKYLSSFMRILEMILTNCEINLQLKWPEKFFLVAGTAAKQLPKLTIADTKLYVPLVTSST